MTRGKVLVGVRKRSGPFVIMITPYMVDVVTSCQQNFFLFEGVISLASDDITISFEQAIFASHGFSTAYYAKWGFTKNRVVSKAIRSASRSFGNLGFSKRDRELHFEFGNSLCWNIGLHVLKRTCIGGGLVWDSCSHAFSFGFSPTVFTFLFRVKLLS